MSILSQNQRINDVIPRRTHADAVSIPIFAPDFSEIEFSLLVAAASDFDIIVVKSNQEDPPDLTSPQSATNMFADCSFSDESTNVNYNSTSPYNPSAAGATLNTNFKVQTEGARWVFIVLLNYMAGSIDKLDANLFSNET